jgi:ABC-type polysaccharide/polyol phosphate transport system ATPase subunit
MTEPAVAVEHLGKRYAIGRPTGGGMLYDRLATRLRPTPQVENAAPTVWALADVSFSLPAGHVLGVLGRNGSGKTTLMKILARVTVPTTGVARVAGRVGALLQVGTGFHPQLTGRDNIALSGAILGMSRAEIAGLEPAIIDFAEIGRFLDTPVKFYSSGMYLRLAFSVAAHLPAEILLVDEVLAVGDAAFQAKCRERILSIVRGGRTVLFVSHGMESVKEICDSVIVLEAGRLAFSGSTADGVIFYEQEVVGGRYSAATE